MPEIDRPKPGHFCWFELATSDQAAAKQFYSTLFGWTCNDVPMGPGSSYTMFQVRGRDVGAAHALMPEQAAQGVPPHWGVYVAVASADETAAKAASLGGKVLAPAFDVFDAGRMAVLQDPTGAVLSVWQAKQHQGVGIWGEHNTCCWSEVMTRDIDAATQFYSSLFGWTIKATDATAHPYYHWRVDGQDIGGMMKIKKEWGEVPSHWMNYVSVPNCDATAAQAAHLQGKILMPPTDIPEVGRFAMLQDPQGAAFSIIQLLPMRKG